MNAAIRVNGVQEALDAASLSDLLRARGIARPRGVAVAVNGAVVPASAWDETTLAAGDEIEIVRPFGGG